MYHNLTKEHQWVVHLTCSLNEGRGSTFLNLSVKVPTFVFYTFTLVNASSVSTRHALLTAAMLSKLGQNLKDAMPCPWSTQYIWSELPQ